MRATILPQAEPGRATLRIADLEASPGGLTISIQRQRAKGKASCEMSADVTDERMSRARGPHSPAVHHAEVMSTSVAEPSSGSRSPNHFMSRIPSIPPVTTRKRLSPRRMIVRSVSNVPAAFRIGV